MSDATRVPPFAREAVGALYDAYEQGVEAGKRASIAHIVASFSESTERSTIHRFLSSTPPSASVTIENKCYGIVASVSLQSIVDGTWTMYVPHMRTTGESAALWYDLMLAEMLKENPLGFDGTPFFSELHPCGNDRTFTNDYCDTPLSDWRSVRESMMLRAGEDGRPLGVRPSAVLVSPAMRSNYVNEIGRDLDVHVMPFIEDGTWYMIDLYPPFKALLVQIRQPLEIRDEQRDWTLEIGIRARGAAVQAMPAFISRCRSAK